ncbi:MAG: hypothetical protein JNL87_09260 [Burkholderiaceae bacterium]|nr:hypothetical protein [Burkholderiaceae bacterium]
MMKITPTRGSSAAVESCEYHVLPVVVAFALGVLVMDLRADVAQAERTEALVAEAQEARAVAAAAVEQLRRAIALVAQIDGVCGAPAGTPIVGAGAELQAGMVGGVTTAPGTPPERAQ